MTKSIHLQIWFLDENIHLALVSRLAILPLTFPVGLSTWPKGLWIWFMSNSKYASQSSLILIMWSVWAGGSPLRWLYHIFVQWGARTETLRGRKSKDGWNSGSRACSREECVYGCMSVQRNSDTADMCHLSSRAIKLNWHKQPRAALSEMDFT